MTPSTPMQCSAWFSSMRSLPSRIVSSYVERPVKYSTPTLLMRPVAVYL
jgi:hypothetical protein